MACSHVLPSTGRGFPQPLEGGGKITQATNQLETNMKMDVYYYHGTDFMDYPLNELALFFSWETTATLRLPELYCIVNNYYKDCRISFSMSVTL